MSDETRSLVAAASAALPAPAEWQTMAQIADVLITSGLLPAHIKTPQAALAIMLKARELGVPTMHGLSTIVVVQGKPTCNGELMLALIYRDQGDDAIVIAETTAERCTISYKRRGWTERQTYSFTMDDARRAGLASAQTWQKYPAAMLRARCISAVARMAFPDSIAGMYGYEELGVSVDVEDGQVVIAAPDAPPEPAHNGHARDASGSGGVASTLGASKTTTVARSGGATVTAPVPEPAPQGEPPATLSRSAADWTRTELRGAIREAAGEELAHGKDWVALARSYAYPEVSSSAEMTQAWFLGLYQAMRSREYAEGIAGAPDAQAVERLRAEALGEADLRRISAQQYHDLAEAAAGAIAALEAGPLTAQGRGRAQVAS